MYSPPCDRLSIFPTMVLPQRPTHPGSTVDCATARTGPWDSLPLSAGRGKTRPATSLLGTWCPGSAGSCSWVPCATAGLARPCVLGAGPDKTGPGTPGSIVHRAAARTGRASPDGQGVFALTVTLQASNFTGVFGRPGGRPERGWGHFPCLVRIACSLRRCCGGRTEGDDGSAADR